MWSSYLETSWRWNTDLQAAPQPGLHQHILTAKPAACGRVGADPNNPPTAPTTYRVCLGPPQREEAGEEELGPADDSSQAPVEASHAFVRPGSPGSLSAPGVDPAVPTPHPPTPRGEKKKEAH